MKIASAVFIAGSSRSGTTLLSRAVGLNSQVHSTPELHFVGELWDPSSARPVASASEIANGLERAGEGRYLRDSDPARTRRRGAALLVASGGESARPAEILLRYLDQVADDNEVAVVCEQTPANVYFIAPLLEALPQALVLGIVRDPRDVLLSQKRWWRQVFQGGKFPYRHIPWRVTLRRWADYNPIVMALMWKRAAEALVKARGHERVKVVVYEELVADPHVSLRGIADFIGVPFETQMADVPRRNSSHRADAGTGLGMDASSAGRWTAGLSAGEVWLCERTVFPTADEFGYTRSSTRFPAGSVVWSILKTAPKLLVSLILRLGSPRQAWRTLRARTGHTASAP
ncbi:sulfotransferase family protein [Demequina maris]|uniref:sulfotransferase family protein n=1 Tax=Demequina maris TaxID=1638982 RepID=UPI0014702003|nr:sulfotransferase [Demequina maris]